MSKNRSSLGTLVRLITGAIVILCLWLAAQHEDAWTRMKADKSTIPRELGRIAGRYWDDFQAGMVETSAVTVAEAETPAPSTQAEEEVVDVPGAYGYDDTSLLPVPGQ